MSVKFEIESSRQVVQLEIGLEDGELPLLMGFQKTGPDGRYFRGISFKPVVNGTWPLVITARDSSGNLGVVRCVPGVTVTQ